MSRCFVLICFAAAARARAPSLTLRATPRRGELDDPAVRGAASARGGDYVVRGAASLPRGGGKHKGIAPRELATIVVADLAPHGMLPLAWAFGVKRGAARARRRRAFAATSLPRRPTGRVSESVVVGGWFRAVFRSGGA